MLEDLITVALYEVLYGHAARMRYPVGLLEYISTLQELNRFTSAKKYFKRQAVDALRSPLNPRTRHEPSWWL